MFRARAAREPMITARVRPNTMANWHARGRSVWYPICQSIDLKVEKKIEDSLHIPTHPYTSLHIPTHPYTLDFHSQRWRHPISLDQFWQLHLEKRSIFVTMRYNFLE